MKHRSPVAVLLLPFITLGIYSLYWQVSTKIELNTAGAKIPTAWLIIIPFVNIWWLYKYSQGVDEVTAGKTSTVVAFLLLFFLGFIGEAVIQSSFNGIGTAPAVAASTPEAPTPPSDTTPAPTDPTPPAATPPAATPPVV
jgi:hypothetical protein